MSEKEEEIQIEEQEDGSVVTSLPSDEPVADQQEDGDEDQPNDTDAVREARRARRRAKKELIKRTNEEKDHRLTLLQRQNNELMERLAVIERKSHSSDLAKIDKAIEDQELRIQYAAAKMKEATNNSDGEGLIRAQELWYESRSKLEAIKNLKNRAVQASSQESGAIDPVLKRHADRWMEENSWYNPAGEDEDSRIAKVVDEQLVREGWDPKSEEYWDELTNRLRRRAPHLYNESHDESPRRRPKSFVTGSGRESRIRGESEGSVVLSREQVNAIKEAGMWDDPDKRQRMIKRYAQEARKYRS